MILAVSIIPLTMASCGKDPVYAPGDYVYENDDFTKVDNIYGVLVHWNDTIGIEEEQKSVIRNLIANMVRVEGGRFLMGAQCTNVDGENFDPEAQSDESPVHEVTLSDYYIGKYEVTQREWSAVMGYDLGWSDLYGTGDRMPAYNVSHTEAEAFVERLSTMTRLSFRLPTEAQWEYAARGGSQSQHWRYSGGENANDVAWHNGNAGGMLHLVGGKQANELGLCDMSGNLWEWCRDSYGSYSVDVGPDPSFSTGSHYVLRGGAWTYLPAYCRVSCRDQYDGAAASVSVGFRVAMRCIP